MFDLIPNFLYLVSSFVNGPTFYYVGFLFGFAEYGISQSSGFQAPSNSSNNFLMYGLKVWVRESEILWYSSRDSAIQFNSENKEVMFLGLG